MNSPEVESSFVSVAWTWGQSPGQTFPLSLLWKDKEGSQIKQPARVLNIFDWHNLF